MKSLTILGATGSIGRSALDIVRQFPDRFAVHALTAHRNIALLAQQIETFQPALDVVADAAGADALKARLPDGHPVTVLHGSDGYVAAAGDARADLVVAAMVGAAGLLPALAAIDAGIPVALANKETLVMAGELVMARVRAKQIPLLPIDSEHSAIHQCLAGERPQDVATLLLTGSGGPFRQRSAATFAAITVDEALAHPNWAMGPKITIDSATMMNKGLEIIEARWLFDIPLDHIQVVVHPQSIVHSMVAFVDGAVKAQLGVPDMRGAIAYALTGNRRLPLDMPVPDFPALGALEFYAPDPIRFPCLGLAMNAARLGMTYPAVLNAANEAAVAAFLEGRIDFIRIPQVIETVLDRHQPVNPDTVDRIVDADRWARDKARRILHDETGRH